MTVKFRTITPETIGDNVFQMIGQDWFLLTTGDNEQCNTMTASWGGLGVLWNKNVCFVFVRPSRYTYDLLEKNENFTLSFFEEDQKDILTFCGTNSGKDMDKIETCELTKRETAKGGLYFAESRLVIECKKLYFQDIDAKNFLAPEIQTLYPAQTDYHRMYIGEIVSVLEKE